MQEIAITTVYGDNTTAIPAPIRRLLNISPGDKILWYANERGEICIKRIGKKVFREIP